jgi:hypothetical protein
MLDVPRSDEIPQSKRKNAALTATIASLFFMSGQSKAQELKKTKQYSPLIENQNSPNNLMFFGIPQKDIHKEFPGREYMFRLHPQKTEISTPKQQIEHKTQLSPLAFEKRNIRKYFPEREACFKEIISTIEKNPALAQKINTLLQTLMKPRIVHKETNRRPRTDKDITGAIALFLDGVLGQKNFSDYLDNKDKLYILETDTVTYDTRLEISDHSQIAREMIQPALDAVEKFLEQEKQLQTAQKIQQEPDKAMANK